MFDTTLSQEYARLAQTFGYGRETLIELARAGLRDAFLTPDLRKEVVGEFEQRLSSLVT
jgi:adenosine deaminase